MPGLTEARKEPAEESTGAPRVEEGRLRWVEVATGWGRFALGWTRRGIAWLGLPGRAGGEAELPPGDWLRRLFRPGEAEGAGTTLAEAAAAQLQEYFSGRRQRFDLPLDLRGTPFQLQVWQELLRLPFGETVTYAQLAARVGRPRAARAVGGAMAANPVPLLVPCHRVVAEAGLGGYGGGLELKRRLLRLERGEAV
ncbi:MAG: methylated-DNA--[protein]-cysteine S-methyltransferase [Bacillota bacterium]|nr:methylated-DNA--[protein]-cysteine S-methyltransferase [Bacillota bacterium]